MAVQKMMTAPLKKYELPPLPYAPDALEPHISKEQLSLHHDKHHQGYVTGANANLEKLEKARQEGLDLDMKALLKELSFNIGGHVLHSLFWPGMAPAGTGGGTPGGALADMIDREWGSFDRFKSEFSKAATSTEGSGWAALAYCTMTDRPMGARLLRRLQEQPGPVRRCILERRELGRGGPPGRKDLNPLFLAGPGA